jgi:hypothetical protein
MTQGEQSEIWLYGSTARGDGDERSDVDVLVAGAASPEMLAKVPYPREALSVVSYDWDELRSMADYGSLFLHHVAREGRPIVPGANPRLRSMLDALGPYARADRELACFAAVLDDVEDALALDHVPGFELSVVATSLRHACILGCYGIGRPTFGRRSAFEVFLTATGKLHLVDEAARLYEFRLHEDGRGPVPYEPTTRSVEHWVSQTRDVIGDVKGILNA